MVVDNNEDSKQEVVQSVWGEWYSEEIRKSRMREALMTWDWIDSIDLDDLSSPSAW